MHHLASELGLGEIPHVPQESPMLRCNCVLPSDQTESGAWQYSGVSSEPGLVRDGAAATLLRLLEGSIRAVLRQRGCARSLTEALKSSESVFLFQALCPQTPASYLFHFITGNRLAPECMLLAVRWARAANARRASLSCWQSTRTGHQPFKLVSRRLG